MPKEKEEKSYKPNEKDLGTFQQVRDYLIGMKDTINNYLTGSGQFAQPQPNMYGMQPAMAMPGMQQGPELYGRGSFNTSGDVLGDGLFARLESAAGKYLGTSKGSSKGSSGSK
jgi:hypothetical protein